MQQLPGTKFRLRIFTVCLAGLVGLGGCGGENTSDDGTDGGHSGADVGLVGEDAGGESTRDVGAGADAGSIDAARPDDTGGTAEDGGMTDDATIEDDGGADAGSTDASMEGDVGTGGDAGAGDAGGCSIDECTINGSCVAAGTSHPTSRCLVCDPARDAIDWSPSPQGTVCRAATGLCDVAEACDGANGECPADQFAGSTVECRAAGGACDPAEFCTGSDVACPVDQFATLGADCDDGLFCNGGDTCDGAGSCVHAGDPCAGGDACNDTCDEMADHCFAPVDTPCNTAEACAIDNVCDGAGSCTGTIYDCGGNGSCDPNSDVCLCDEAFYGDYCDQCSGFALGTFPNCTMPPFLGHWTPVPTGVDVCRDELDLVDCSTVGGVPPVCSAGVDFCGQDGQYELHTRTWTCYDDAGAVEPCGQTVEVGDVIEDSVTGLFWTRQALPASVMGTPTKTVPWQTAWDQCQALVWGGYSDWTLPTIHELESLTDRSRGGSTSLVGFIDFLGRAWSTTGTDPDPAVSVRMHYDFLTNGGVASTGGNSDVLCVRNRPAFEVNRYTETAGVEPTVQDSVTGLEWTFDVAAQPSWKAALDYCEASTYAGYDDWRLPDLAEFSTITDKVHTDPADILFPFPQPTSEWTSTPWCHPWSCTDWPYDTKVWVVHSRQYSGMSFARMSAASPSLTLSARCVRSQ